MGSMPSFTLWPWGDDDMSVISRSVVALGNNPKTADVQ